MATLYRTDGTDEPVSPANGTDFKLDELYQLVGDPVDIVRLPDGNLLVVHDEGLILGLPLNEQASALAGGVIVGDAVRCSSREVR